MFPFPAKQLQKIRRTDDLAQSCHSVLATMEDTISKYHVNDAGEQKINDFPYLRTNRFLAAYSDTDLSRDQRQQLFGLLEQTARHALQLELENLPAKSRQQLVAKIRPNFPNSTIEEVVELCGRHL
ncbi:MAG: hypothetical protein PVJ39_11040, partial [Gammaproteobacteria bacterium]